jgi:hypothetical protein
LRETSLLIAALLFSAARVQAEEAIEMPAECGSARDFEREVEARLGANTAQAPARVRIAREAERYRLTVNVGDESREFDDADCRELFRVAVVVTAAMSLSHTEEKESPTPTAKSASVEAPSAPPVERTTPAANQEPARKDESEQPSVPIRFGAGVASGVNFGMAPRPVLELELEGRAMRGWFGVATRLRYRAPGADEDENGRGVRVTSAGAQLALLVRPHALIEGALGASVYRLSGAGRGAALSQREDTAWSAGPSLGVTLVPVNRGGTWVGVGGELHLDLIRPEFQILNYQSVFGVETFSGSIFLRIGHLFH